MSTEFFMVVSFSVFLFIFIKKLWPSILKQLDQHITDIKEAFSKKEANLLEHEKLRNLYQERAQHQHNEIKKQKETTEEKLDFLKLELSTALDAQYNHRRRKFQLVIHRLQQTQRKTLQARCVEKILNHITEKIKENSSFNEQYMVSLLKALDRK